MKDRPSIWFDFLLVLVTVHFLSDLFVRNLISPEQFAYFTVALVFMLGLRVPLIHNWLPIGLSIAAIVIFFGDVWYMDGPLVFTAFPLLWLLLFGVYMIVRFFGGALGFK